MAMVTHAVVDAARYTVDTWVAFVFLGVAALAVGGYTWWQRDIWAATVRQDFERKGMSWLCASRLTPDGRFRKIARFYGIAWSAVGALLILAGFVVLAVESWLA
ncbi:hypothetical protein [Microcella sp.]|uniref:hypothetical protein n=1 Tax=Microcella sp. TaxID=1913979 RepID=UPI0025633484|nr:hypothetical protein [Microcella sp.]MBX9472866.1 hypothetical protein [Microcella sp.]